MRSSPALLHVVLVAGLLIGAVPAVLGAPDPGSQAAPWWPPDVISPSQYREGWNLRVGLQLTPDQKLPKGSPVQAHLDLGCEALKAGWPESSDGEFPIPFTLDPDSLRLVRYSPGWNDIEDQEPVPITVAETWYNPDQSQTSRCGKVQSEDFDSTQNPLVTVEWRLTEDLAAFHSQNYYLYFEILENSDKAPQSLSPAKKGPLDGLYWVGAGTTLYGHDFEAREGSEPTLAIVGTRDETQVTVSTYSGPLPSPHRDETSSNPDNPFTIDRGEVQEWFLGFQPTSFQITADQPVVALTYRGSGGSRVSGNFVPSVEEGLSGSEFYIPSQIRRVQLIPVDNPGPDPAIGYSVENLNEISNCNGRVDPDVPRFYCVFRTQGTPGHLVVEDDRPVLVQDVLWRTTKTRYQASSVFGAPTGPRFLASTITGAGLQLRGRQGAFSVDVTDEHWGETVAEDLAVGPQTWTGLSGDDMRQSPEAAQDQTQFQTVPLRIEASSSEDNPQGGILVRGGTDDSPAIQSTPFGGPGGRTIQATTPFVIHPFYPDTEVEVALPDRTIERGFSKAGWRMKVFPGSNVPAAVNAGKPVSVFPLGNPHSYSRFLAAKPGFETPKVVASDYRGYLIDVALKGGSSLIEGSPGESVRIPFRLHNLGRWNGDVLPDSVTLEAETNPSDWPGTVVFEKNSVPLATGDPVDTYLDVVLPEDMPANSQVGVTVEATSENNENMTASFDAVVFTRQSFGVDMWFGEATSTSGDTTRKQGFDPGQTRTFPLVVKNTGTTTDAYNLSLSGLAGGWSAKVLDDDRPVEAVGPIPPGERASVTLEVQAPETREVADVIMGLTATSQASASAVAGVQLQGDLSLTQSVDMVVDRPLRHADPGRTVPYDVTVTNTGEGGTSLEFGLLGDLPPGWTARFTGLGDPEEDPVALQPGQTERIPLEVAVPSNATAHQLVSVLLRAQGAGDADASAAAPLSVVVDEVHDLQASAPDAVPVRPGETISVAVNVTNRGNGPESVRIVPASVPGDWIVDTPDPLTLGPNASGTASVTVEAPASALEGPRTLKFAAAGGADTLALVNVTFPVQAEHNVTWQGEKTVRVQPQERLRQDFVLVNQGNVREDVRLTVDAPVGWTAQLEPEAVSLSAGASRRVTLEARAGGDVGSGTLTLRAAPSEGVPSTSDIAVQVDEPGFILEDLFVPSLPERPGDVVFVQAILHNPSSVPLSNAQVRLVQNGTTLDRVDFDSVGPNRTVVAPLKWAADDPSDLPRLSWGRVTDDGFQQMASTSLRSDAGSDDGSGPSTPAPSAVWVVIGVLAGAWAWRRGRNPGGNVR